LWKVQLLGGNQKVELPYQLQISPGFYSSAFSKQVKPQKLTLFHRNTNIAASAD